MKQTKIYEPTEVCALKNFSSNDIKILQALMPNNNKIKNISSSDESYKTISFTSKEITDIKKVLHKEQDLHDKVILPTGPRPDQYRDCIDIAVKIAFGLNKCTGQISANDIDNLPAIQEVTNSENLNESIFFKPTIIARIRQASSDQVRSVVNKLLTHTSGLLKGIYKLNKEDVVYNTFSQEIENFFNTPKSSEQYEDFLNDLTDKFQDLSKKCIGDFNQVSD